MAKMTLLEMVQDILSDMSSDNVNSIDDTEESTQVAQIIKTVFAEIISKDKWPHLRQMYQLTASGTSSRPTHMSIADDVQYIEWIKYNKKLLTADADKYEDVEYIEPDDFINKLNSRVSTNSNVTAITDDVSGISFLVVTDAHPTYWTSFDDENMVFDSYYSTLDTTLQGSKTQAYAYKEPAWSHVDTAIPDLPSKVFPYFLSECKSISFEDVKQAPSRKKETRTLQQKRALSKEKWRHAGLVTYPDYGRK